MPTRLALLVGCIAIIGHAALAPGAAASANPTASLTYEGDALTLHAASGQVVDGTTNLEAGEPVAVRLRSTDGSNPFIRSAETTVGADGRFEAAFDLSGVAPGTDANAKVIADDTTIASAPVEVVEEPTATSEPTESPGQPGFGIAGALVAVGLVILSRRR